MVKRMVFAIPFYVAGGVVNGTILGLAWGLYPGVAFAIGALTVAIPICLTIVREARD